VFFVAQGCLFYASAQVLSSGSGATSAVARAGGLVSGLFRSPGAFGGAVSAMRFEVKCCVLDAGGRP